MSNQGPGAPPGWKRSPSGHLFRQKNDGSWWWQALGPEVVPGGAASQLPAAGGATSPCSGGSATGRHSSRAALGGSAHTGVRSRFRSAPRAAGATHPARAHAPGPPGSCLHCSPSSAGLEGVPRLADECAGRLVDHHRPRGDRCSGVAGRQADGGGVRAIHHCSDHAGKAHDHDRSRTAKGRDDDCSQTYADHSHAAGDASARTGGDNDPGHGSTGN